MDSSRILVVCTANICRSPMAERLLAEYFVRRAGEIDVHVSSAGTRARPDHAAADGMQRVALRWGMDLDYHRSRRVDASLARQQDLVITMEDRHRTTVSRLASGVGQRTFTITELAGLVAAAPDEVVDSGGLPAQVARWQAARARVSVDAPDVPDPYGGPDEDYETVAWQLAGLVEQLAPALAAATRTATG